MRVERTKVWINVDVNGEGHDGREDVRRTKLVGLPRLAVTPDRLQRRDFLEWFVKELSTTALGTLEPAA